MEPEGTVTVALTADATSPGIGAFTVDVAYDDARLDFFSCAGHASGLCFETVNGNVRFAGASAAGISGSVVLGTVTFNAGLEEGIAAVFDVIIVTLTDPEGRDLTVILTDGAITDRHVHVHAHAARWRNPCPVSSLRPPRRTRCLRRLPLPTPTPAPPIDVDVEIDETGTVGRGGEATIRGSLECSVPSFVDLTVEVGSAAERRGPRALPRYRCGATGTNAGKRRSNRKTASSVPAR